MSHGAVRADVLVVGAGPAGCAAAIGLATRGRSVVLVERGGPTRAPPGETLPPLAQRALERLGVAELEREHAPCWSFRSAWGGPHVEVLDLIRLPYGRGWRVDRAALERALRARAIEGGARLLSDVRPERAGIRPLGRLGWRIPLRDCRGRTVEVRAGHVVDASGRARVWARAVGGRARPFDRLVAVSALLVPGASGGSVDPLVESAPDGWWFTTGTPDGRLAAAWLTDADMARGPWPLRHGRPDGAPHTAARLAGSRLDGAPRTWSARSELLEPLVGSGWCSAGDAAAAHDPLCGNGITYALDTGWRAARAVAAALEGDRTAMPTYVRSVRRSFARYLAERDRRYGAERRWPARPFWSRRPPDASRPPIDGSTDGGSTLSPRSAPPRPGARTPDRRALDPRPDPVAAGRA